jgi:DNA-directed RNA polymerase beta subunit
MDGSVEDTEIPSLFSHLKNNDIQPFTILESYFKTGHLDRLVRHQLESYNHFITFQIEKTIQMFNPVVIHSEEDYVAEKKQYFLEIKIQFQNLKLHPPQIFENNGATKPMYPNEARLRNYTYSAPMTVDLEIEYIVRNTEDMDKPTSTIRYLRNINVGKMPIMVRSVNCMLRTKSIVDFESMGECPHDCGGYFIIKGNEKTVLAQERAAENRIYCFDGKNTTKWSWYAEFKSVPDHKCISPKQIEVMIANKNNGFGHAICVQIPRVKQPIELFTLFRAMGVVSDQEICEHILLDVRDEKYQKLLLCLHASIMDANKFMTQEDAITHVMGSVMYTHNNAAVDRELAAKKKREFTLDILNHDVFPHCRTPKQKLYLLGYMTKRLIETSLGMWPADDRDSYVNKRIELTGTLLNNLLRNYFNRLVKDMQRSVIREINGKQKRSIEEYENIINMTNIYKLIKSCTIENAINRHLATGDFSIKQSNNSKVGVAQVLNRLTYPATLSHLRRVNTPLEKSGELIAPRKLHNTTWGFLCPFETPEGASIGIVKNLAFMAHITIPSYSETLYKYVEKYVDPLESFEESHPMMNRVKVWINGAWIGCCKHDDETNPLLFFSFLKSKKQSGIIQIYTSIIFDFKRLEIRICNDSGRLTRPLLRVENNKLLLTNDILEQLESNQIGWNELLIERESRVAAQTTTIPSIIEYLDVEEQEYSLVAMKNKKKETHHILHYTHCEIHPSAILGVLASCIPFPDHNQAPRNVYECLDVEELVWMADGTKKPIKHVSVGDEVLTFHPTTFKISTTVVIRHFIIPNTSPRYRICTISGRSIVATEDHKFMTNEGWKTVGELKDNLNHSNCLSPSSVWIHSDFNQLFAPTPKATDCSLREQGSRKATDCLFEVAIYQEQHHSFCFVPLERIEQVDDGFVSDIEVESDNHSFIAGDSFFSSNCAQLKQAIGIYARNYRQRMDKTSYVMTYPSRPLIHTRWMDFIQMEKLPSGSLIHVAILSHTGYNQEDSLLINQGSIDRGMFMTTIYHTEKDEDKNVIQDEIVRCNPDKKKTKGIKYGNYGKLDKTGMVPENTLLENRDIIIAKVIPIKENRKDPTKIIKFEDQSKLFRTTEECYVDQNYTGRNGDGFNFAKTRVRTLRKPVIGDKFSSTAAQKGTCGNIIPECDMPFTKDGMRPDLILNPHAIPSRMTIGQLKESNLGKVLLELGLFGDATAFHSLDIHTIRSELQKVGFQSNGDELMYNGLTGEQFKVTTFMGPVYYQRLKHMVNDKLHTRAFGPMVNLTRQPAEGRARDGGFRIGEMEKDGLVAHGMSQFTKERLFDVSDKYTTFVCKHCGLIAPYNNGDNPHINKKNNNFTIHECHTCGNTTEFSKIDIPFAFKLMIQELQTINVATRIVT